MSDEFPFISDPTEEPKPRSFPEPSPPPAFSPISPPLPSPPPPPPSFEPPIVPVQEEGEIESEDEISDWRKIAAIIGGLIVVFVVMIVGVGYYFAHDVKENATTPQSIETVNVDKTTGGILISAQNGGNMTSEYGFEVVVPPGALPQNTEMKIERVALGEVTDLFHLLPDGLKFLKPVTLKIPYKAEALNGQDPETIILDYWSMPTSDSVFSKSLKHEVDNKNGKLVTEVIEF